MSDGTEKLCQAIYDRNAKASDYVGGSEAKMLYDGANKIEALQKQCGIYREALVKITTIVPLEQPFDAELVDIASEALKRGEEK